LVVVPVSQLAIEQTTSNGQAPSTEIVAKLREEALTGRLPLLKSEREFSTKGVLATGFTYAVAAWCFLIGGYVANVVGAVQGTVAILSGCVIGVMLSTAGAALACNRYGLEQIDYTKSCFGQRGAKFILIFYVLNQIGWTGYILVMFGHGVNNVAEALGLVPGETGVRIAVFIGLAVAYAIVVRGVHVLNVFNAVVTPGLLGLTAFLFYVIFRDGGWTRVAAAAPLAPVHDPRLGYVMAFEFGLGAGFSWWPGIGFLARNTDTQRNSLYPAIVTFGLAMGIVCCAGLYASLAYRTYDPTVWMMKAGGPAFGIASLTLVAIANISVSAGMIYIGSLGLRHVRIFKTMPWPTLVALTIVPALGYVALPELLYEKGSVFLTYNATMFAPIAGIVLVDYLILRRQRLNASQIFENHPSGQYWFSGGFNLPAVGCMALGQILYVWLLDPITGSAHGPVRMLTASGPAVLLPMVLYAVLARLWLIPAGLGGYRAPTTPVPIREPNI
jgi:NCS1 family nucleobase:cation symporter-1